MSSGIWPHLLVAVRVAHCADLAQDHGPHALPEGCHALHATHPHPNPNPPPCVSRTWRPPPPPAPSPSSSSCRRRSAWQQPPRWQQHRQRPLQQAACAPQRRPQLRRQRRSAAVRQQPWLLSPRWRPPGKQQQRRHRWGDLQWQCRMPALMPDSVALWYASSAPMLLQLHWSCMSWAWPLTPAFSCLPAASQMTHALLLHTGCPHPHHTHTHHGPCRRKRQCCVASWRPPPATPAPSPPSVTPQHSAPTRPRRALMRPPRRQLLLPPAVRSGCGRRSRR
jgi:hypothetical protein